MQIEGKYYLTSWVQWEVSDKERDFRFCCLQICVRRLFMDRYQTLLDWTDLLQLLLKFFWACLWTLGEEKGVFFFFFWVLPAALEGVQGSSRLINALFWLISHFSFISHFWKILWSDLELGESIFSASVCYFSLFCTLGQCLFFLILLFFLQNFSSNITRDACWCFFFFLNFEFS